MKGDAIRKRCTGLGEGRRGDSATSGNSLPFSNATNDPPMTKSGLCWHKITERTVGRPQRESMAVHYNYERAQEHGNGEKFISSGTCGREKDACAGHLNSKEQGLSLRIFKPLHACTEAENRGFLTVQRHSYCPVSKLFYRDVM